jgi:hypothetical protein
MEEASIERGIIIERFEELRWTGRDGRAWDRCERVIDTVLCSAQKSKKLNKSILSPRWLLLEAVGIVRDATVERLLVSSIQ